jgi:dUTP pyrophosphatase
MIFLKSVSDGSSYRTVHELGNFYDYIQIPGMIFVVLSSSVSQFRMLRICKLSADATTPVQKTCDAAGYDLFSPISTTIEPQDKKLIALDIAIELPKGTYGRIAPRSGLAHKYFLDVGAGVIDRDYRGNICVLLFNFGQTPYHIKKGDRIAQLILEKICTVVVEEVTVLHESGRGSSGFMSTGR